MKAEKPLKITAVGDIAPGDFSVKGLGVYSVSKKYGCEYLFEKVVPSLKDCDILLGNLECALSNHSLPDSNRYPGSPDIAGTLHNIGFDVLSVANNHTFDYGSAVLEETISSCEKAGIKVCGLRGKGRYYSQPVILKKSSYSVGILAYNWVGLESNTDIGEYIAVVNDGIVNYSWSRNKAENIKSRAIIDLRNQNVINDIKNLRKEVDILILMPHWGYEWTYYPPYGVVLEARKFIECGVDFIIGSHPHVPQGIEEYKKGLIVYSLGNFLFDSVIDRFRYGMIVSAELTSTEVIDFKLSFVKRGTYHRPELPTEDEILYIRGLVEQSSKVISSEKAELILDDELIYEEFEKQYKQLKYEKIRFLFFNIFKYPFLIKLILGKISNVVYLVALRFIGKKVRW